MEQAKSIKSVTSLESDLESEIKRNLWRATGVIHLLSLSASSDFDLDKDKLDILLNDTEYWLTTSSELFERLMVNVRFPERQAAPAQEVH
ncbi:MAG: hypothetical protein HQK57_16515 [Deltaproteobacteria bacterium]|nr:hypothetical protein [Deltaproteobacteria bacterium]